MEYDNGILTDLIRAPLRIVKWQLLSNHPELWSDEGLASVERERNRTAGERAFFRVQELTQLLMLLERCRRSGPEQAFFGIALDEGRRNLLNAPVPAEILAKVTRWKEYRDSQQWEPAIKELDSLIDEAGGSANKILLTELRWKLALSLDSPGPCRSDNLERAIELNEATLEVWSREEFPEDWARTVNNLANLHLLRIKGDRAENLERAIAMYRDELEVRTREAFPDGWATAHCNMGLAYWDRAKGNRAENLDTAIRLYHAALEVWTRDTFPRTWASTSNHLANAYCNRISGDLAENIEKGLELYREALELCTGDAFAKFRVQLSANMANALDLRVRGDRADNIEEAIGLYKSVLETCTRETSPYIWAQINHNLSDSYAGRIHGNPEENTEKAIELLESTLEVLTREVFPPGWATSSHSLAVAYKNRKRGNRKENIERSLEMFESLIEVWTRESFPQYWAFAKNNMGNALKIRIRGDQDNNLTRAETCFKEALEILTPFSNPRKCREAAKNLAEAQVKHGRFSDALETVSLAREADDILRRFSTTVSGRAHEFEEGASAYYLASYACARLGDIAGAVDWLEQGKLREVGEVLARDRAIFAGELTPPDRASYEKIILRLRLLESEQRGAIPGSRSFTQIAGEAMEAHAELNDLISRIQEYAPDFMSDMRVSEEEISSLLTDEETAFVLFNVTKLGTAMLLLGRRNGTYINESLNSDEFTTGTMAELSRSWSTNLEAMRRKEITGAITKMGSGLYDRVFEPVQRKIEQIGPAVNRLVLVPHLSLHNLPLHLMNYTTNGNRRYLIEDYEISFAPSLKVFLGKRSNETGSDIQRQDEDILIIANPTGDLEWSMVEAEKISEAYPRKSTILSGRDATVDSFMELSPGARIMHLACHGLFDIEDPWNSGIVLAGEEAGPDEIAGELMETVRKRDDDGNVLMEVKMYDDDWEERVLYGMDGAVHATIRSSLRSGKRLTGKGEVLTLKEMAAKMNLFRTELVVLSACESGLVGVDRKSDEFIGLPGGFIRAGARTVIASLWAVDDMATLMFMAEFYRSLIDEGFTPSRALREAQLTLASQEGWSHPYYWGGFRILIS